MEASSSCLQVNNGSKQKEDSMNNEDICRDFLRNLCTRGHRCKFKHPCSDDSRIPSRTGPLVFCHDYQNAICSRANCKFFHGSRQDEEYYKVTGDVPRNNIPDSTAVWKSPQSWTRKQDIPVCKDHLTKGECNWGKKCKFLHVLESRIPPLRSDDCDTPDAKRRMIHHEEVDLCIHSYAPQHFECGLNFEDKNSSDISSSQGTYSLPTYHQVVTTHSNLHLPSHMNGCKQLDICVLSEENLFLKRQVEELKKQVSDLMATNEVLLDQNAHLRIHGKLPSVTTVSLPSVTIHQLPPVTSHATINAIHGLASIPTVQTVQALATLPLVTAQSASTLSASIPFATSVSLTQPTSLATVSIAPVTINHQASALAASSLSAATAAGSHSASHCMTLTPTINAAALQLQGPSSTLTFCTNSGAHGGSLVSYPIMTQSLVAPTGLQTSRHADFT